MWYETAEQVFERLAGYCDAVTRTTIAAALTGQYTSDERGVAIVLGLFALDVGLSSAMSGTDLDVPFWVLSLILIPVGVGAIAAELTTYRAVSADGRLMGE